ncbi:response regulator transcription factor [Rhodovastum atsumiense]|uniref:response regulator transcription factor n=1 Tax=Rhodovastum atsumiense TaxID=504468 RepID=UPI00139F2CC8|nr:response regulator [Rhodovastum atsumiense]
MGDPAAPADRAQSVRILAVDDDAAITAATVRLLSRHGCTVDVAHDGETALQLARQHPPDLVLLDVMLPDIDGTEVCRRLKADPATEASFVVLCSALRTDAGAVVQGLSCGADGYLTRPLENREMLARVEAYLRHKSTIDALRDSERQRREQFERERQASYEAEIRALGAQAVEGLPVSAWLYGAELLREAAPSVFAELQAAYADLINDTFEQQVFREDNDAAKNLRALAERLFQVRASARDVTELHYHALCARTIGEPSARARALMECGRLTLLELMGRVLNAYRSRYPEIRGGTEAVSPASRRASS